LLDLVILDHVLGPAHERPNAPDMQCGQGGGVNAGRIVPLGGLAVKSISTGPMARKIAWLEQEETEGTEKKGAVSQRKAGSDLANSQKPIAFIPLCCLCSLLFKQDYANAS